MKFLAWDNEEKKLYRLDRKDKETAIKALASRKSEIGSDGDEFSIVSVPAIKGHEIKEVTGLW